MELIQDIQELLRIDTEYEAASVSETAPFGEKVKRGLLYMQNRAQQDGFETKLVENQALAIMLGSQKNRVEAVSHMDVVPAVGSWTYPPYAAQLVDGKIYARGSQDMKTQVMITYYALKKIREEGHTLKRSIRVVVGSDEEQSMEDIVTYLNHEGLPDFAFTPDSSFPICLGEKGAVTWDFESKVESEIMTLHAGSASNVVVPLCTFTTLNSDIAAHFSADKKSTVEMVDGVYTILVHGKAAHTSRPEHGDNALIHTLGILCDFVDEPWIHQLYSLFYDMYGKGFGLEPWYEPMGAASTGLNILNLDKGVLTGSIDIRYPNPLTVAYFDQKLEEQCAFLKRTCTFNQGPIEADLNNPFVQAMISSYTKHVANDTSAPFYSGGVTYSKVYQNRCVGFGAHLPLSEQPSLAHQVDEYVLTKDFDLLVEIYKDALIAMANV